MPTTLTRTRMIEQRGLRPTRAGRRIALSQGFFVRAPEAGVDVGTRLDQGVHDGRAVRKVTGPVGDYVQQRSRRTVQIVVTEAR